jgi:hypothetical protein
MESKERTDRTWLWILVAVIVAIIPGVGIWNRRAPANSVDQSVINDIERELTREGFTLTNSTRMKSEAVLFGIPVSKILGTVDESASLPFRKDAAELKIDYAIKGNRLFNISIWTDSVNSARAGRIARGLQQPNSKLSVKVWTNSPAP